MTKKPNLGVRDPIWRCLPALPPKFCTTVKILVFVMKKAGLQSPPEGWLLGSQRSWFKPIVSRSLGFPQRLSTRVVSGSALHDQNRKPQPCIPHRDRVKAVDNQSTIPIPINHAVMGCTCTFTEPVPGPKQHLVWGSTLFIMPSSVILGVLQSVVTCGFRLKGFPHDHGNQFLILVRIA